MNFNPHCPPKHRQLNKNSIFLISITEYSNFSKGKKSLNEGCLLEMEQNGGRPHKACRFTNRTIIRHFKKNPFDSANNIIRKLKLSASEKQFAEGYNFQDF